MFTPMFVVKAFLCLLCFNRLLFYFFFVNQNKKQKVFKTKSINLLHGHLMKKKTNKFLFVGVDTMKCVLSVVFYQSRSDFFLFTEKLNHILHYQWIFRKFLRFREKLSSIALFSLRKTII